MCSVPYHPMLEPVIFDAEVYAEVDLWLTPDGVWGMTPEQSAEVIRYFGLTLPPLYLP